MSISYYKNQLITNFADSTKINYKAYYHDIILFGANSEPDTGDTPTGYSEMYLTTVAKSSGTIKYSASTSSNTISYSTNNGTTWSSPATSVTVNVNNGDTVMWKGNMTPNGTWGIGSFNGGTASFDVQGNAMSLIYGDNFATETSLSDKNYVFKSLFKTTKVISAANLILPATTLSDYCYDEMFRNCSFLTQAPELPATTLAQYCYENMFRDCSSLTQAPTLPATTLARYCYVRMFVDCSSLNYIKMLATDVSASMCLYVWVSGVAASGTFVKAASMTTLPSGASGIPNGWTVEDATS